MILSWRFSFFSESSERNYDASFTNSSSAFSGSVVSDSAFPIIEESSDLTSALGSLPSMSKQGVKTSVNTVAKASPPATAVAN